MSPWFLVAMLAAVAYLPVAGWPPSALRSAVKTLAVGALAVGALGGPALLIAALALCALGDLFLSRDGDKAFAAGVAAFALGHLAYVALFLGAPNSDPGLLWTLPRAAIALGLLGLGVLMTPVLYARAGDLRVPVVIYVPIILGMALAALSLPGGLIVTSALLFVLSDLVLAGETFLLPADHPARRVTPFVVWPTYWAAQAGFFAAFTGMI